MRMTLYCSQNIKRKWNTIFDFMFYETSAFKNNVCAFLSATKQYVFVSSARVYADSKNQINENSPRLLDVCDDEE